MLRVRKSRCRHALKRPIRLAKTERVRALQPYVQQIMDALGVDALVTDESRIGHFEAERGDTLLCRDLSEKLGIKVQRTDYVWEVAFALWAQSGDAHP